MLLHDVIRRGAERHPDRDALLYRDRTIAYGQLAAEVNRMAAGLRAHGIRRGDAVALLLPNCPEFTVAYYAAAALGALCVPANPLLKAPELEYIWGDCRARTVVTAPALVPGVLEARHNLPHLGSVLSTGFGAAPAGTVALEEILAAAPSLTLETEGLQEDDPAVCIYTSGTTGRPKGALLSHRNLLANARQVTQAFLFTPDDTVVCVLPLFHSFAATVCQNTTLHCGARVAVLEQFHPARTLEAIAGFRATIFPAVPAMFAALLQFAGEQPDAFERAGLRVGGRPDAGACHGRV